MVSRCVRRTLRRSLTKCGKPKPETRLFDRRRYASETKAVPRIVSRVQATQHAVHLVCLPNIWLDALIAPDPSSPTYVHPLPGVSVSPTYVAPQEMARQQPCYLETGAWCKYQQVRDREKGNAHDWTCAVQDFPGTAHIHSSIPASSPQCRTKVSTTSHGLCV